MTSNSLLTQIRRTSAAALQKGALQPIDTICETLPASETSPRFLLRKLSSLRRKDDASRETNKPPNPFLPYEPAMYVCDIAPDHVLLLNKFNVLADHVLIVTKQFEEQSSLLTAADFNALWHVVCQIGGVSFYNAGKTAGASQRHKHLQVVVGALDEICPFDAVVQRRLAHGVFTVAELPFAHAAVRVDDVSGGDGGAALMERYVQLLRRIEADGFVGGDAQPFAYNLVATRSWMMVVPRREELFRGVGVNALAFTGCLLVRNDEQMQLVKRVGGMQVLLDTGFGRVV